MAMEGEVGHKTCAHGVEVVKVVGHSELDGVQATAVRFELHTSTSQRQSVCERPCLLVRDAWSSGLTCRSLLRTHTQVCQALVPV